MRDYSKVSPRFWIGSTGKKLRQSKNGLIVSMYLMTCGHANMLGLYYLPVMYIAHETGLGLEGAQEGLDRAISDGLCSYDNSTECVWVHEMARFQVGDQLKPMDNQVKGVQREYDNLPENPFLSVFYDKYKTAFHMSNGRGLDKPLNSAIQAPFDPLPSQEQEQAQEQDQEHPQESKKINTAAPVLNESTAEGQDSGWSPSLATLNTRLKMAGGVEVTAEQLTQILVVFNPHYDDGPSMSHNKRLGKLVQWIKKKQDDEKISALKVQATKAHPQTPKQEKPIQQVTTQPEDHEIFAGVFTYGFIRAVATEGETTTETMIRIMRKKQSYKPGDIEAFVCLKREKPSVTLEQVNEYSKRFSSTFSKACEFLSANGDIDLGGVANG